jgi:hypothetical protein
MLGMDCALQWVEAVARVIKFGGDAPELIFNYQSRHSRLWDNASWMEVHGYSVRYPEVSMPVAVDL